MRSISLEDEVWPEVDEASDDSARKLREEYEDYCIRGGLTHFWEIAWQLAGLTEIMRMMFTDPDSADRILSGLHKIDRSTSRLAQKVMTPFM